MASDKGKGTDRSRLTRNNTSTSTAEDDGADHIDSDTPRSGIATPRPDPSDKRLPGIMHSYFQVGPNFGSSEVPTSVALESPAWGTAGQTPLPFHQREETEQNVPVSHSQSVDSEISEFEAPLLPHEAVVRKESVAPSSASPASESLPYPTPPDSKPPSLQTLEVNEPAAAAEKKVSSPQKSSRCASKSSAQQTTTADTAPSRGGLASTLWRTLSSMVSPSSASNGKGSSGSRAAETQSTPVRSRNASTSSSESTPKTLRRKLTKGELKSQSPTPTRALSSNTPSETAANSRKGSRAGSGTVDATKSASPDAAGAPVKAPRGKLTVRIIEARGLRRCKDPYVVAVFQRNELLSKGPQHDESDEEDEESNRSPPSSIPISRQGSDSGRPMAIPMRSRQSSSISINEARSSRPSRKLMTDPKWDTEAVL